MARIHSAVEIDPDELAELSAVERYERRSQGIWAHRPAVAAAMKSLHAALVDTAELPPRLIELVRLRIAFHNQCRSCMALRYSDALDDGLTEDLVCSLERPYEADNLSAAEKVALRFADLFATNHLAIDTALLEELRLSFSEAAIVELGTQCARMVGFGRLAAVLGVYEDLPERFSGAADVPFTPWGGEVLVRRGSS